MKKLLASVAVVGLAVSASAQSGDADASNFVRCEAGPGPDSNNETAYKVFFPSGASDYWNVDFDLDCAGFTMAAIIIDYLDNAGIPGDTTSVGLYTELSPGVPDLSSPITVRASPAVVASDGFNDDAAYTVPCTTLGSSDVHMVSHDRVGDSHIWTNADTSSSNGRTYFTTNGYAGGTSLAFSVNMDMAVGGLPSGSPGDLLINGSASTSVDLGDNVSLLFFGPAVNTQFALYFCFGGAPFFQLLPLGFTKTDHAVFGGPCPGTWLLTAATNCNTPTGGPFEFCTLYADTTDLKPNGKAKIKQGSSAFLTINGTLACGGACFGTLDDCVLDSTIWKVQNPAGTSDWFNVNHGTATSSVASLTGVSISSWDFCGFGPCWAETGIYPANLTLDPAGCTPDVTSPLATVGGTSACMAPAAGDWGCPLTLYATPTVAANSSTTYHVAARWPTADSCMWLGSDTDGIDTTNPGSGCGTTIPSSGCESLFTTNSYTTPGVGFTGANWMMQIDWN